MGFFIGGGFLVGAAVALGFIQDGGFLAAGEEDAPRGRGGLDNGLPDAPKGGPDERGGGFAIGLPNSKKGRKKSKNKK